MVDRKTENPNLLSDLKITGGGENDNFSDMLKID